MENIMVWSKYTDTKNAFKGELKLYHNLATTDIVY